MGFSVLNFNHFLDFLGTTMYENPHNIQHCSMPETPKKNPSPPCHVVETDGGSHLESLRIITKSEFFFYVKGLSENIVPLKSPGLA